MTSMGGGIIACRGLAFLLTSSRAWCPRRLGSRIPLANLTPVRGRVCTGCRRRYGVRWCRPPRGPSPGFCKHHTTCPRWWAAAMTIVVRNHTGAGTAGGRGAVLGRVVRPLCQRADRLKVREAVSLWDGGLPPVLLAACRAPRACAAVPRVRGTPWHKACWHSQTETSSSTPSAARRCPRAVVTPDRAGRQ